jgi:plastocyanin
MPRSAFVCLLTLVGALPCLAADEDKWVTVKGKFVWDEARGAAPKRTPLKADTDAQLAAKDPDFNSEEWIVNARNGGIKNVIIWLGPELTSAQEKELADAGKLKTIASFKAADIHPALAKPEKPAVEIDQPCCRFIPHIVLARAGQDMVIKNSAPVSHNAWWVSVKNGEFNPIITSKGEHVVKNLVAETGMITIKCSIHKWMYAWVRVFDHPYFALTDDDGNFEIKNAPLSGGKLRLYAWHESAGWHGGNVGRYGKPLAVKTGTNDLGAIKLAFGEARKEEKK